MATVRWNSRPVGTCTSEGVRFVRYVYSKTREEFAVANSVTFGDMNRNTTEFEGLDLGSIWGSMHFIAWTRGRNGASGWAGIKLI